MKTQSKCGVRGRFKLRIKDKFGKVRDKTDWIENTISNNSLAVFAGLAGATGTQVAFTFLAVGTDDTAASAAQTKLIAEVESDGLERAAATVSRTTTTQTNDTLQLVKEWTATGTVAVEEIGVFNVVTADTIIMAGRSVTGTKTVNNTETIEATYQIIFS